eukprot:3196872-Rhodomonas_salina.2
MSHPLVGVEALPRRETPSRGEWRSLETQGCSEGGGEAASKGARRRGGSHRAEREGAKKAKQRRRARGEEEGVAEPVGAPREKRQRRLRKVQQPRGCRGRGEEELPRRGGEVESRWRSRCRWRGGVDEMKPRHRA